MKSKKVGFIEAIRRGFEGFVKFRGTASRSEFWFWVLFTLLLSIALGIIEEAIWPTPISTGDLLRDLELLADQPTPFTTIASLALFLPGLSVTVRRFHDAGFSGKWLLMWLAPIAYGIFAAIGAVLVIASGSIESMEDLIPLIFLLLPLPALGLAILVMQLFFTLRPTRSFYDGNKYAEPEPLPPLGEGTTA